MKILRRALSVLTNEFHALAWTLAGAGTVLITLSGTTRVQGFWITVSALGVHLLGVLWKSLTERDGEE